MQSQLVIYNSFKHAWSNQARTALVFNLWKNCSCVEYGRKNVDQSQIITSQQSTWSWSHVTLGPLAPEWASGSSGCALCCPWWGPWNPCSSQQNKTENTFDKNTYQHQSKTKRSVFVAQQLWIRFPGNATDKMSLQCESRLPNALI